MSTRTLKLIKSSIWIHQTETLNWFSTRKVSKTGTKSTTPQKPVQIEKYNRSDFERTRTLARRESKRMASENPLEVQYTSWRQAVNEDEEIHELPRRCFFWMAAWGERGEWGQPRLMELQLMKRAYWIFHWSMTGGDLWVRLPWVFHFQVISRYCDHCSRHLWWFLKWRWFGGFIVGGLECWFLLLA